MKSVSIITCIIAILLLSSCGSVSKTGYVASLAQTKVYIDTLRADLDITQEIVEAKASSAYFFGIRVSGDNKYAETGDGYYDKSFLGNRIDRVKSAAIYNALEQSGADIIITPQYVSEEKNHFIGIYKTYTVKLKGYKATIREIRQDNKAQHNSYNLGKTSEEHKPNTRSYSDPQNTTRQFKYTPPADRYTTNSEQKEYQESKAVIFYKNGAKIDARVIGEPSNGLVKLRRNDGSIIESRMADIERISIK